MRMLPLLLLGFTAATGFAATILTENFDNVAALTGGGWAMVNNSAPLGTTGWFQGNSGVFGAQSGAPNSYVAANFQNAAFGGNISNWLITPVLTISNGDSFTFFTRTEVNPAPSPDRLEVRFSTNGASTNVGGTDSSVGDFTNLLLTVNPLLTASGYPATWTMFTATISGLGGPMSGRYAFRYFVTNTTVNADYIGIDTLSVNSTNDVPEPGTVVLLAFGMIGLGLLQRQSR